MNDLLAWICSGSLIDSKLIRPTLRNDFANVLICETNIEAILAFNLIVVVEPGLARLMVCLALAF